MVKKIKDKKEILPESKVRQLKEFPCAKPINLSEDQREELRDQIDEEIGEIEGLRTKYGLLNKWREGREQYAGIIQPKDFPWAKSSNLHIHITSMAVDVLNVKAKSQMFVSPAMICRPLPAQGGNNLYKNISLKEKFMDYKMLEEIDIEDSTNQSREDAINLGTGITKVIYDRRYENGVIKKEIYEPTIEDIMRFMDDFKDDNDSELYKQYLSDLGNGIPVELWYETDEMVYNNPKLLYVKLENLYLRPDIPDILDHRIIQEKIDMTWLDIENQVKSGFFDKNLIADLKEKYPDEYTKKSYDVRETIYYYDYDNTGYLKRLVYTYLKEEHLDARLITYPYTHLRPYYVLHYIKKRKDSIYGEGLADRLKDTNKAINQLWNQTVDSGTLRNAPVFKAANSSKDEFDPEEQRWAPATIFWMDDIKNIEAFQLSAQPVGEMINYISRLERYAEWITGVTAYMTGRESPLDPNAPMGKAYMLLKESNLRVSDSIKNLHRANKEIYEQVDSLIYQYIEDNEVPYLSTSGEKIETENITKKILGIKVQYIPQLSDIVVNKELQKEQNMTFSIFLMKNPIIQQLPGAIRTILEILIRGQGGIWEKNINKLLPPEEEQVSQLLQAIQRSLVPNTAGMSGGLNPTGMPVGRIPAQEIPA